MRRFWLVGCLLGAVGFSRAEFDVQFTPEGPVLQKPEPAVSPVEGLVVVPWVNLRRVPGPVPAGLAARLPYGVDENQETQLLFGEQVRLMERRDGWIRLEALEQSEWTHSHRWQGYPGWVPEESVIRYPSDFVPSAVVIVRYARFREKKKAMTAFFELPLGSRLGVLYTEKGWVRVQGPRGEMGWMTFREVRLDRLAPKRNEEIRPALVAAARQFLGEPYYRGGRCGHKKKSSVPTGVDCSGLINLAYRAVALNAPRDAQEQFLLARRLLEGKDLRPGDLVFLAKKNKPDQITHVMMFEKKETLIEAVHERERVQRISFKKKFRRVQKNIKDGDVVNDRVVYLGSFLSE